MIIIKNSDIELKQLQPGFTCTGLLMVSFFLKNIELIYLSIFVLSSQIWTDRASFFEIVCWRNSHCEVTITDGRGMSLRSG